MSIFILAMSKISCPRSIAVLSIVTTTISLGFAIPALADTALPIDNTIVQIDPKPSPQPSVAPTQDTVCGTDCMTQGAGVWVGEQNPSKSPRSSRLRPQRRLDKPQSYR